MAPLVYMVQALRFFAFDIKAFIGIESFDILKHKEDSFADGSFSENPKDLKLYVDDLKATGIKSADIYVSCDKQSSYEKGTVLKNNFFYGFVSKQYKRYLENRSTSKNILAFTCGPNVLMEKIHKITSKHDIPLKVLMERRMGCGIGVCLSCVCKTNQSTSGYSRVCIDGPIFNSEDIKWR